MKRETAMRYASYGVDDTGAERDFGEAPENARLVGWQCGFEPMFVVVWSYLGVRLDDDEAEDIARDYLEEKGWFANPEDDNAADYVL